MPIYNWSQFSCVVDVFFHLEGVLRDHTFYNDRHWDEYLVAIYRDEWLALAEGDLRSLYE